MQNVRRYRASGRARELEYRRRYGLSLEEYDRLFAKQDGVCAICGRPDSSSRRENLTVDHDHTTGKIRGLLCGNCNRALGFIHDDSFVAHRIVQYLENAGRNSTT